MVCILRGRSDRIRVCILIGRRGRIRVCRVGIIRMKVRIDTKGRNIRRKIGIMTL